MEPLFLIIDIEMSSIVVMLYLFQNASLGNLYLLYRSLDMTEKTFEDLPVGDTHLREDRVDGEDVYGGIFLKMKRDQVRLPDGKTALREYLTHPGAVAVVAILDDGRILLERQYRYPIAKACIEIPAGKLEPGENHLLCAQRELEEETGYTAKKWSYIRRIHPVISYSTELIDIYLEIGRAHV